MPALGRAWTALAKLQAVITTAALSEAEKSAWCRTQDTANTFFGQIDVDGRS